MAREPFANPANCNCLAVRQAALYSTQFYDQYLAAARLRRDWDDSVQAWVFENAGQQSEVGVEGPLVLSDTYLVASAVLHGIGVAYRAEPMVRRQIGDGQLIPPLGDWCGHSRGPFCSIRAGARSLAFIDFMRGRSDIVEAGRSRNRS
jgi:DNA-binding transcriptional LysR family regulator